MKFQSETESAEPSGCTDHGVISCRGRPDPDVDSPFIRRILTWVLV